MNFDNQYPQSPSNDTTSLSSPAPGPSDPAALPFENDPILPWPEPVDGAQPLDDLVATVTRYVVLPKWAPQAIALFNVHTFAFHLRSITTYLGIESSEKRCGKTTLLKALTRSTLRRISPTSSPATSPNSKSKAFATKCKLPPLRSKLPQYRLSRNPLSP